MFGELKSKANRANLVASAWSSLAAIIEGSETDVLATQIGCHPLVSKV